MIYLLFLAIGLGISFFGLKTKDEVYRLSSVVVGALFLICGFALTPMHFQMLVEIFLVVPLFFVCVRCLGT